MHMTHEQDPEVLSGHSWIVTLAEVENVTDAAAMLGTTQPTLSRRLATLESALGASLFDRPGRRLRLNDAGRIYVDAARRADFTMAVACARIAEMHGGDDELRLLTELRDELELDRLHAAAIELAAKARHRRA